MGLIHEDKAYGLTIRESANDGSDFTNPDADYRRLFLGEDGQLHVKDSAGAVTDIGSATTADHNHTTAGGDGGDLDGARVGDYLEMTEIATPSTPASGFARIYAKSDGRIYSVDDGGTEYGPFDTGGGGGSGYRAAIEAHPDLVFFWPADEAPGSTTFAETNGGTALTNQGSAGGLGGGPYSSLVGDPGCGSISFGNGTVGGMTGRANITGVFRNTDQWTVEFWYMAGKWSGGAVFGHWDGSNGPLLFFNALSDVRCYFGGSYGQFSRTAAQVVGRHYIAITWDGSTLKCYWDAVDLSMSGAPTGTANNPGGLFLFGGYNSGQNFDGGGIVCAPAVYSDDLSSGEVSAHYALGLEP